MLGVQPTHLIGNGIFDKRRDRVGVEVPRLVNGLIAYKHTPAAPPQDRINFFVEFQFHLSVSHRAHRER